MYGVCILSRLFNVMVCVYLDIATARLDVESREKSVFINSGGCGATTQAKELEKVYGKEPRK